LTRPSDTAEAAKWDLLNSRVLGTINIYVVPALQYLIVDSINAAEAWKTLKDNFGKTRGVAGFVHFKELFNIRKKISGRCKADLWSCQ
jgi:hypothetical protein